jgi:transposase
MANGNQVDSQVFGRLLAEFSQQWNFDGVQVADAALYTANNLKQMGALQWVSRVPLSLGSASRLLDELASESFFPSAVEGYELSMVCNCYAEVNQHWLVVRSQPRQDKDLQRLEAVLQKAQQQAQAKLQALEKQTFECPVVAGAAAEQLNEQLPYHQLVEIQTVDKPHYGQSGRPAKGVPPTHFTYQVRAALEPDTAVVEQQRRRAGGFILATPVLEGKPELSAEEILRYYRDQQDPERGFRFCKDPMFFADSVFLKTPRRIEALSFIMGLCLLVYALGQRYLRQELAQAEATLPNQLGQPTARPTLRWIFQCFQAVHLLVIQEVPQVVNLNPERLSILQFFPKPCLSYYLLC